VNFEGISKKISKTRNLIFGGFKFERNSHTGSFTVQVVHKNKNDAKLRFHSLVCPLLLPRSGTLNLMSFFLFLEQNFLLENYNNAWNFERKKFARLKKFSTKSLFHRSNLMGKSLWGT
jgi:hypothetical protein